MRGISSVIGLLTAATGLYLLNDQRKFSNELAQVAEADLVDEDYLHHLVHSAGDTSPNGTLNHFKHWLTNPARFHFITRPMVHVNHFIGMVQDNLVPLGLIASAVIFGFRLNPAQLAVGAGKGVGNVLSMGAKLLGGVGRGIGSVTGESFRYLAGLNYGRMGGHTALALASMLGLGLYTAHQFKRELTDENREHAFNFLHPPSGH